MARSSESHCYFVELFFFEKYGHSGNDLCVLVILCFILVTSFFLIRRSKKGRRLFFCSISRFRCCWKHEKFMIEKEGATTLVITCVSHLLLKIMFRCFSNFFKGELKALTSDAGRATYLGILVVNISLRTDLRRWQTDILGYNKKNIFFSLLDSQRTVYFDYEQANNLMS